MNTCLQHGDPRDPLIISLYSAAPFSCLLAGGVLAVLSEVHMNGTADFFNNSAHNDGGGERHHAETGLNVNVIVRNTSRRVG